MGSSLVCGLRRPRYRCIHVISAVFWGTALVFFLAKWINVGNTTTQDFWTEVCEQIENGWSVSITPIESSFKPPFAGLFCLTGIGLIPWRLIDTYRA